ncbi:hypothetical protein ACFL4A_00695 [bacterium]
MLNLIPMAGKGNRFIQKLYRVSKPFIPVMNVPMIIAALKTFPAADSYVFVCSKQHYDKLKKIVDSFKSNVEIITVEEVTQGQACTCLLAEEFIEKSNGLFIASCDYQMVYDEEKYQKLLDNPSIDVIIWTFKIGSIKKANPEHFAYCRVEGNRVTEIVEKRTISDLPHLDPAVVGSFTYKKSSLFIEGAKNMIKKNILVNNEFYAATSINQLIEKGYNVVAFEIDKFISFGTPFELQLFHYWEDYFTKLQDHDYKSKYNNFNLIMR